MFNCFDSVVDACGKSNGHNEGCPHGNVEDRADVLLGVGKLLDFHIDILNSKLGQYNGEHQARDKGDDKSVKDFVALERDTAEEEVHKVAGKAHEYSRDKSPGAPSGAVFCVDLDQLVGDFPEATANCVQHGRARCGIQGSDNKVCEQVYDKKSNGDDDDGHDNHGQPFFKAGSRFMSQALPLRRSVR